MKYLIIILLTYCLYWLVGYMIAKKRDNIVPLRFLSVEVTTALKGFAILIILIAHLGVLIDCRYVNPLGSMGTGIFLFCSGYGIQKSTKKNGLKNFWKKRIQTAYIPYIIVEIIFYFIKYQDLTAQKVLYDILLIKPLHPFGWYMQYIFIMYSIYYLSSKIFFDNQTYKLVVIFGTALTLYLLCEPLYKQQLFTFSMGVIYAIQSDNDIKYLKKFFAYTAIGCLCLVLKQLPIVRNGNSNFFYFLEAIQTCGLVLGIVYGFNEVAKKGAHLLYSFSILGCYSLEIYLLHVLFIPTVCTVRNILFFFAETGLCSITYYHIRKKAIMILGNKVIRKENAG